jgi:choline dehydrogenase-like flavoprotein
VIVGAGSAGCVLAARLTEDPDVSVALLEAGGVDSAEEIQLPIAWSELFKGPFDWDLDSEPEPGLDGRRIYLPRRKVLGGSSSINAMIYVRGHRADYDGWAASGATGWAYDDVLPYFRRSEDNERGADHYHGAGGPLAVSDGRSSHRLSQAFLDAAIQAGYRRRLAPKRPSNPHGPSWRALRRISGWFSGTTAISPARARPSLRKPLKGWTSTCWMLLANAAKANRPSNRRPRPADERSTSALEANRLPGV